MKKFLLFFAICIICFTTKSHAAEIRQGIDSFPESYRGYLQMLKDKHSNWEFSCFYTGLDYNEVIDNEYGNSRNLVPITYNDRWKNQEAGLYNVEIDKGWVNASKRAVEYTMDPRNFLNEVRIFQFEKLSYDPAIHSKNGVEKILYGTEFYQRNVSYKTSSGSTVNMNKTYSDLIWEAAIYSGVSPYHLASRIKQELGGFVTHASISGTVSGYEGLYNFYNIGATSSTENLGAVKNGLAFARDGKGLSEVERQNLFLPWNTPERAIIGGAVFIGSSYISVGQNTLYLQKFSVNSNYPNKLYWHQYMTNCLAPYNESVGIYNAYTNNGVLNSSIGFLIPVYENMPGVATESPRIDDSSYVDDSKSMYANVNTTLNVRSGPGTDYEILTSIPSGTVVTRLKRGTGSGEVWDKVQLENGAIRLCFCKLFKRSSSA